MTDGARMKSLKKVNNMDKMISLVCPMTSILVGKSLSDTDSAKHGVLR